MKITKSIALILALVMLCAIGGCGKTDPGVGRDESASPTDSGAGTQSPSAPASTDPTDSDDGRITFACAGDNIIHESLFVQASAEAASSGQSGRDYYFDGMYDDEVRKLISGADIAFVNQEGPIAGLEASGYPNFNAPKEAGDALVDLGFDIVNIANNHMLDMEHRTTGYENSIKYWKSKDVMMVGGYEDQADYDTIRYIEREGIKIAILSYTYGTNGYTVNEASSAVVPLIDDARITAQVTEARASADLVLVSMHWGDENKQEVSSEQRRLAKVIADAGADAIIGHHSHTIQPIEWTLGKSGNNTLVIYSLGNFISSQLYAKNLVGVIVTFDIVKKPGSDRAFIENVKANPTVTHYLSTTEAYDSLDLEKRYNVHVYMMKDYTAGQCALHGAHIWDTFDLSTMKSYVTTPIKSEFLPDYLK